MSMRDQILTALDVAAERVEVPEWKDSDGNPAVVYVREMSGTDRERWAALAYPDGKARGDHFQAFLLVVTLYDAANGARIFTDEDLTALAGKSRAVIDRLYDIAAKLNGLREKDAEAVVKNS